MILPDDVARCSGVQYDEGDWREGCEDCMRRAPAEDPARVWMLPPRVITFECEFRIAREDA